MDAVYASPQRYEGRPRSGTIVTQPWQVPEAIAAALATQRVYGKSYRCRIEGCRRKGEPMSWLQMQKHVKREHKKR